MPTLPVRSTMAAFLRILPFAFVIVACPNAMPPNDFAGSPLELYMSAAERMRAGDFAKARTLFEAVAEQDPENMHAQKTPFAIAYATYRLGRKEEAGAAFREAMKQSPFLKDYALYFLATMAEEQDRPEEALALYGQLLGDCPDSVWATDARNKRIAILESSERWAELAQEYEQLAVNNNAATAARYRWMQLSALSEAGNKQDAIALARQLVLDAPALYGGRMAMAYLRSQGAWRWKRFSLNEELARLDAFIDARRRDDANSLRERLQNAANTEERQRLVVREAEILIAQRKYEDVEVLLDAFDEQGLNLDEKVRWRFALARSYARQEKYEEARDAYRHIGQSYPGHKLGEESAYNAALVIGFMDKRREAAAEFANFINRFPTSEKIDQARWNRAWLLYLGGEYAKASPVFLLIGGEEGTPGAAKEWHVREKAAYWYARSLEKSDQATDAIAAYKKLIVDWPFSYHGLYAKQRLETLKPGASANLDPRAEAFPLPNPVTDIAQKVRDRVERVREWTWLGGEDYAARELRALAGYDSVGDVRLALALARDLLSTGDFFNSQLVVWKNCSEYFYDEKKARYHPEVFKLGYPLAFADAVRAKATEAGLPPALIFGVMREESRYQAAIRSWAGAVGLIQIMPATGKWLARKNDLKDFKVDDLENPEINLSLGSGYLAGLIKEFNGVLAYAVGGYNAGPGNIRRWRKAKPDMEFDEFLEDIPFDETRYYVKKVLRSYMRYQMLYPDGGKALDYAMISGKTPIMNLAASE